MSTPPRKPDFTNVKSSVTSTEQARADFGNVQSTVTSTEQPASDDVGELKPALTYTVAKGDTLSKIAKKFYGDSKQWRRIFEANKDTIENPDLIYPGQVLKIPNQ